MINGYNNYHYYHRNPLIIIMILFDSAGWDQLSTQGVFMQRSKDIRTKSKSQSLYDILSIQVQL